VVSAAVLVKLKPEFAQNTPFVSFVDTLIRDTANPSVQERYSQGNVCVLFLGISYWGSTQKSIQHTSGFSIGVMSWST
jgi:endoglucanase Acf2